MLSINTRNDSRTSVGIHGAMWPGPYRSRDPIPAVAGEECVPEILVDPCMDYSTAGGPKRQVLGNSETLFFTTNYNSSNKKNLVQYSQEK